MIPDLDIVHDPWAAGIFGHGVYNVCLDVRTDAEVRWDKGRLKEILDRHADRNAPALYCTKVDVRCVKTVGEFEEAGFRVLDVNITFGRDAATALLAGGSGVPIEEVRPEYEEEVLRIASTCFEYSRFHLDPLIPSGLANRIKREWVLSYLRKRRGERLWVAVPGGRPAGFLAIMASEADGRRVRTVELIGVDGACRRQGIGRALMGFFVGHYGGQCDLLQVGTQVANIPSMRLYEQSGFSVIAARYVLHRHVGSGEGRAGAT